MDMSLSLGWIAMRITGIVHAKVLSVREIENLEEYLFIKTLSQCWKGLMGGNGKYKHGDVV